MNKRYMLAIMFALALIEGRALFLLMMEFLSMGGIWICMFAFLSVFIRKGIRRGILVVFSYIALMLALWFSNAFYAPYQEKTDYTQAELTQLCESLISQTNALYTSEFDKERILFEAPEVMNVRNAKAIYFQYPEMMDFLNLSGVFIPFTGQAVINQNECDFLLPFVCAHELSHRKGILNEGQANMHAFVRCVESGARSFQYSASVYALKYAMNDLKNKNGAEYYRLKLSISDCVQRDLSRMSVTESNSRLFDYASLIPCLIEYQSITSQGVMNETSCVLSVPSSVINTPATRF